MGQEGVTVMDSGWHLDKRVPIALILAILFQTAGALMWAGAATERLSQLESQAYDRRGLIERTARLEEQTRHLQATLDRIEDKIDKAIGARE